MNKLYYDMTYLVLMKCVNCVHVPSQSLIKDLPTKPFGTPFDKVWHITLTLGTRLRFYDCFIQTSVKKCTKRFCGEVLIRDWDGTRTIAAAKKRVITRIHTQLQYTELICYQQTKTNRNLQSIPMTESRKSTASLLIHRHNRKQTTHKTVY